MNEEELVAQLGFRVVERPGPNAWAIERVTEEGHTVAVRPVLHPEVWTLWTALRLAYAGTEPAGS